MIALGPTFEPEIVAAAAAAGLAALPISYRSDGRITGRESLTPAQAAVLNAVLAAHDPTKAAVPTQVELWKARVVMKSMPWGGTFGGAGKTVFDAVQAAAASISDSAKKRTALEALDYTNFLTRSGTIVKMIQQALGMTDEQCDALFIQAAAIQS